MKRAFVAVPLLFATAITIVPAVALARPDDGASVDEATRERSRVAFRKGVQQLRAQDWVAARASFESAWSLFQHPSILLNLGIAHLRTDDPVLAEQDLLRFLSEDPGAASDELATARETLAEARTKIGTLRVTASPASARIVVDDKALAARDAVAEARLKIGPHAVTVAADGFLSQERSINLEARGEAITVTLVARKVVDVAPPPEPAPSIRPIVGWSLVGLGAAGLVAGTVCGIRATSLADDYKDPGSGDAFQSSSTRSEGIGFRTAADVSFGVGIVAAAVGVVLLLTSPGEATNKRPVALRW